MMPTALDCSSALLRPPKGVEHFQVAAVGGASCLPLIAVRR